MITLIKNYSDENKNQKRINVKKMISLKELIEKPIQNITFKFSEINDLMKLKNLTSEDGQTEIRIFLERNNKINKFMLKNKRKVNNKLLYSLNLIENVIIE